MKYHLVLCSLLSLAIVASARLSSFSASLGLTPFDPVPLEIGWTAEHCQDLFLERYDTSTAITFAHARYAVLSHLAVLPALRETIARSHVRLKIEHAQSPTNRLYTSRREAVSDEVQVGYLVNDLVTHFCEHGGCPLVSTFGTLAGVSRYTGFVRTVDFGVCTLDAARPSLFPAQLDYESWISTSSFRQSERRSISWLYLITEETGDLTLDAELRNRDFFFPHGRGLCFDALRSVLLQVLSSLYYASKFQFTHWNLRAKDVVSARRETEPGDKFWHFDIMPFDEHSLTTARSSPELMELITEIEKKHRVQVRSREHLLGDNSVLHMNSLPSMIFDPETERRREEALSKKLRTPLLRFRVPTATRQLYKIANFVKARISKEYGRMFSTFTSNYDPFVDLIRLALDILQIVDFQTISEHVQSSNDPLQRRDFYDLQNVLLSMVGWFSMDDKTILSIEKSMAQDLDVEYSDTNLSDKDVFLLMATVLKSTNSHTETLFQQLLLKRSLTLAPYSDEQAHKFRLLVFSILKSNFFATYRAPK